MKLATHCIQQFTLKISAITNFNEWSKQLTQLVKEMYFSLGQQELLFLFDTHKAEMNKLSTKVAKHLISFQSQISSIFSNQNSV